LEVIKEKADAIKGSLEDGQVWNLGLEVVGQPVALEAQGDGRFLVSVGDTKILSFNKGRWYPCGKKTLDEVLGGDHILDHVGDGSLTGGQSEAYVAKKERAKANRKKSKKTKTTKPKDVKVPGDATTPRKGARDPNSYGEAKVVKVVTYTDKGNPETIEIKCTEKGCNNTRVIKVQDAFQVKRCDECQKKFRKEQQRQYRQRRAAAKK
jgi:hypothetical protein